ncbi:alkaline phosphatase, partial [[Kitasatospora] papulosa]
GQDGSEKPANWQTRSVANPHMKFYNGRRGYALVTLGTREARADFRTVSAVTTPGAPVGTAGSFVTEAGNPGLTPV